MTFEKALFSLDDTPGILGTTFDDGTPVWISMRFTLRLKYMESLAKAGKPGTSGSVQGASSGGKKALLRYIWHAWRHRPLHPGFRPDVLSIANYEGNPACPNRMTVFLNELPGLKRFEWLYSPRFTAFGGLTNTASFDWFYLNAMMRAKVFRTRNSPAFEAGLAGLTDRVIEVLKEWIPESVIRGVQRQYASINPMTLHYRKLLGGSLNNIKPRFVLCSEGNNGDWRHAVLFDVCRGQGIPTGEVQHGIFNVGMKYGSKLAAEPAFARYKSQYQFTFGPFHCSQTNVPSTCVPLGHYDLEKSVRDMESGKEERPSDGKLRILFIGEGIPPSSVNNGLIRHTAEALKMLDRPFELVIRLHPSEGPDEKYSELLAFAGSRYSTYKSDNIHVLLNNAHVVISHASTVVFEALYFQKPVLVLNDENTGQYLPDHIGNRFQDAAGLEQWLSSDLKADDGQRNFYWAQGSVAGNFASFLESLNIQT